MWLSQRRQTELEETAAELGQVTVPGAPAGVALAGERRGRPASWERRRGRRSRRGRCFFR